MCREYFSLDISFNRKTLSTPFKLHSISIRNVLQARPNYREERSSQKIIVSKVCCVLHTPSTIIGFMMQLYNSFPVHTLRGRPSGYSVNNVKTKSIQKKLNRPSESVPSLWFKRRMNGWQQRPLLSTSRPLATDYSLRPFSCLHNLLMLSLWTMSWTGLYTPLTCVV